MPALRMHACMHVLCVIMSTAFSLSFSLSRITTVCLFVTSHAHSFARSFVLCLSRLLDPHPPASSHAVLRSPASFRPLFARPVQYTVCVSPSPRFPPIRGVIVSCISASSIFSLLCCVCCASIASCFHLLSGKTADPISNFFPLLRFACYQIVCLQRGCIRVSASLHCSGLMPVL